MFAKGSYVVYRAEGVCLVSDIREESFGVRGAEEQYYILTPIVDKKSTVFVPINNEKLCSMMRRLLTPLEIEELCAELREERFEWIAESRGRNAFFKEIFATGDRADLIKLVNTIEEQLISVKVEGKKPTATDTNALYRAKQMLYAEFSATSDIGSYEDISTLLRGELKLGGREVLV